MALKGSGHVERLPSGSLRVSVHAGRDPLTGRQLWHRETVRTEHQAQIALGRLLEMADDGRRPDTRVIVAGAIARFLEVTELELSTRRTYVGYIQRTILPALGSIELRKVRGPVLDTFYSRLRRCGNVACNGRPFTEHVSFPRLVTVPGRRPAWQQVTAQIKEAISSGLLAPGDQLPSAQEMADRYGLRLVLRSLKGVHKASPVGAWFGLGPSPDPGPGAATRIVNADESSASAAFGRPKIATAAKPLAKEYDSSLVGTAITASALQVTVAGHPSASLTKAIASQADGIPVSIRVVPHSEAQLEQVQAKITADLKYWTARDVHITAWSPDLSSDKVSVTLSHYSARAAKLITARYGPARVSVSTTSATVQPSYSRTDDIPPWFGADEVEHRDTAGNVWLCTSGFSLRIGSTYLVPTDTHCFQSNFFSNFYNPGGTIGDWHDFNDHHDTLLINASSAGGYIWSDPTSANRKVVGVASTDPVGGFICTDGLIDREVCDVRIESINQNVVYTINGTPTTVSNTVFACQTDAIAAFSKGDSGGPVETTIGSTQTTARGSILAQTIGNPLCGYYLPERYIESDFGATTLLG